jgi:hypothetical protein
MEWCHKILVIINESLHLFLHFKRLIDIEISPYINDSLKQEYILKVFKELYEYIIKYRCLKRDFEGKKYCAKNI